MTSQCVTARRPPGTTAMRLRSDGWRAMGASTVPESSLMRPGAHDALVDAREAVVGELLAEGEMGEVVLRGDYEARGVLVYAVDDAGPALAAYAGEALAAVET